MPAATPERHPAYTVEQWEAACANAKGRMRTVWENPPYAGVANPEGWRWSQCYMSALRMFPEVVHLDLDPSVGPKDIPAGSEDVVNQMEIEEGTKMVDFHGEYDHGRYYPLEVYIEIMKKSKQNPMTRQPIKEDEVVQYTAHIVPKAGRRRKTRKGRKGRKGRKERKHTVRKFY